MRFVYGENWAFRPAIGVAAEHAGRVRLKEIEVVARWMQPPWGGYLEPAYGGGVLFDAGAHALELARLLLGRPQATSVSATLTAGPSGTDVAADVEIMFEQDRRASVRVAWGAGPFTVRATAPSFSALLLFPWVISHSARPGSAGQ